MEKVLLLSQFSITNGNAVFLSFFHPRQSLHTVLFYSFCDLSRLIKGDRTLMEPLYSNNILILLYRNRVVEYEEKNDKDEVLITSILIVRAINDTSISTENTA